MAVKLHDLNLAELRSLSRQLGGPDSYNRSDLLAYLDEHYRSAAQRDPR